MPSVAESRFGDDVEGCCKQHLYQALYLDAVPGRQPEDGAVAVCSECHRRLRLRRSKWSYEVK